MIRRPPGSTRTHTLFPYTTVVRFRARDLGAELVLEALLLEDLVGFLADFAVHAGQDLVEIFDHRDLGADAPPYRAQFQADDAAADHDQMARHLVQFQRAGRIDDPAAFIVDQIGRAHV